MRIARLVGWLLAGLPGAALAQGSPKAAPEPIKFGQLETRDLTAAPFVADSAAPAVVLCDYGTTRFEGHSDGLRLVFERITRIKILKKSGYDWATVEVPLYHRDDQKEELGRLRGCTYNLEGGKVRKTALAAANMFTEERSKNVQIRKFTLPDVREGSVVEYSYVLRSDFLFNFQDWTFQRTIPTRWSEYRATIPGFYRYKIIQQTFQPFTQHDERVVMITLGLDRKVPESAGAGAGMAAGSMTVTAPAVESRWAMQNLPAYHEEPFTTIADDYLVRLDFELAGTQWEGEAFHDLSETWPKINAKLLADDNFGLQLKRGDFLKTQMQALATKYPDPAQRAAAVREVVLQSVRYDGTDRLYTTASLKRAYDAHRGTSADVNLLFLAALRDAGLAAQPVLLSTRDHGQVSRNFPLLEKFNYVVGLLELPGGAPPLLLDATEPLLPCGVLPERCLNRTGRLVVPAPGEGRWVDLTPAQHHVHFQQVQLMLAADGSLSGQMHEEHSGYAAADERGELSRLGEKKYLAAQTLAHAGGSVSAASVLGREEISQPLQVNYTFHHPAEEAGAAPADQLYLSPFSVLGLENNPFKHDERQLPVDFGSAREETRLLTLTLPNGYELTELPKSLIVNLPDDGGRYLFGAVSTGATVQLTSRLSLRKPVYSAAEYVHLRDVYRLMLAKQAEKIVLKKKA